MTDSKKVLPDTKPSQMTSIAPAVGVLSARQHALLQGEDSPANEFGGFSVGRHFSGTRAVLYLMARSRECPW